MTLTPAVTNQQVFAADIHGRVYAFDRENGKRQWRSKTEDRISGGLYAGYGQVLYGTREGDVVALDSEDGEQLWRTEVSSEVLAAPTSNGGLVVAQTIDGHVLGLGGGTGEQIWDYETTVPNLTLLGGAQPVIVNDRVYAGFASGKVAAIEADTGAPLWERRVAEPSGRSELDRLVDVNANMLVENGGVFTATFQGQLSVLDWENGRPYWSKDLSSHQAISSYLGTLFVADDEGLVRAAEQRSGSFLWQQDKLVRPPSHRHRRPGRPGGGRRLRRLPALDGHRHRRAGGPLPPRPRRLLVHAGGGRRRALRAQRRRQARRLPHRSGRLASCKPQATSPAHRRACSCHCS